MKRTGTASRIEIRRWVTESKMFSDNYPVFAVLEDEDGNVVEKFSICGCIIDGESMSLRIRKK